MSEFEFIDYQVNERVAEITMQRAPVNAITVDMAHEVINAYYKAKEDDGVGAIILTSAFDNVFSAGFDLKYALPMNGQELRKFVEVFYYKMHEAQYRLG
ncbi:MAG: enoyl-CoA hydratase/isomerase family protein, partial [Deltaproteobacteria bacterium]|nr:enoyl-CoA hydratase/isomerase family protein [Deltaproteobacteria bacterium]